MWSSAARGILGAALIAGVAGACTVDPPASAARRDDGDDLGAASQGWTPAYCILNAHTDNGTVHFQGPNWLLTSSEGLGPQEVDVRVQQYVQPAVSASGNFNLDAGGISTAVGYNMAERYEVVGGARLDIASLAFQRLEAYTAYQRTIWEIRDADCNTVLGLGASYLPIGVFFRTVDTSDVWLPDLGVTVVGPVGVNPGDLIPVGPAATGPAGNEVSGGKGSQEAGAADAGAADAGVSDAGAADGG